MRCFVVISCEIPKEDISESLDVVTGAVEQAKRVMAGVTSPCAYDADSVRVMYQGVTFNALSVL